MKHGIAILGLGLAVEPHARSLRDLSGRVDVRWAFSRSEERCRAFARTYDWPTTTDIGRVFRDPSVEAALILTPPATHLDLVRQAAAAGKDILLEKPIEVTLDRAREVTAIAAQRKTRIGIVLQHRFRKNAQRLKRLLESGDLGSVEGASITIPWWRPQSYYDEPGRGTLARDGGGVLLTQAIHTIDLFRWLAGPVRSVAALTLTTRVHVMETEDFAGAVLELGNGRAATIAATTAAYPGHAETIGLYCTRACATLRAGTLTLHWIDGRTETFEGESKTGGGENPMDFSHAPHAALIGDFLDAREKGAAPLTAIADALQTHELIDAILRASRQRAWVEIGGSAHREAES